MPLAELDPGERAVRGSHGTSGCREAISVEGLDERGGAGRGVIPCGRDALGVAVLEVGGAVLGERRDGIRPGGGTQEAQRLTFTNGYNARPRMSPDGESLALVTLVAKTLVEWQMRRETEMLDTALPPEAVRSKE